MSPGSEPLRSIFPPGSTRWAVRRAQWRSMGIPLEDFDKPKIAVVNSSSSLSSCYSHLDGVSEVVQAAIRAAGGLPFEIRTIAPSDFITSAGLSGRYLMPSRDLVVNDIEVMVEGAMLDGMVCLSSCDKTTPAHLMAAGRLDVPTLVVPCGYQHGTRCGGQDVDINDLYEAVGAHTTGRLELSQLCAMSDKAISGPGVCAGLGTANTMHIVAEALGMTLPGSAPVHAGSARLHELARLAGARVVDLVTEGLRPRTIMSASAFENAVTVTQAVGGSVNAVRHLAAIATESGLAIDVVDLFASTAERVPLLCGVRPNGPHRIEDLDDAGGARALMEHLRPLLREDALTVSGSDLETILDDAPAPRGGVIHSLEAPYSEDAALLILRGSLAPDGAIVKASAFPGGREFEGPACVFESEDDAMEALKAGEVGAGDVAVLRGLGARGGPGTAFAAGFVAALNGAGRADSVAVVTDGELSGLNRGITVGQVMPEAADGGPLAAVEEGDRIRIDLDERQLNLLVPAEELERRLGRLTTAQPTVTSGWLGIYRRTVGPIARGAVVGDIGTRFGSGEREVVNDSVV
jgi:dihydroxy-acid dehydratase